MSCKDFEKNIVLYTELSATETNLLQQHVQSCQECQNLFLEVQTVQISMAKIATAKAEIRNAARLTNKVMEKVAMKKHQLTIIETCSEFLQGNSIKYAFASVSLSLIIVFSTQFFSASWQPENQVQNNHAYIKLNSTAFRQYFLQRKEKQISSSTCASPFRHNTDYLLCLKNKLN